MKALTGDQYIKVKDMIKEEIAPVKIDVQKNEDDIGDVKICLAKITSVADFLKWGIPIGIAAGISLGSIIAKLA